MPTNANASNAAALPELSFDWVASTLVKFCAVALPVVSVLLTSWKFELLLWLLAPAVASPANARAMTPVAAAQPPPAPAPASWSVPLSCEPPPWTLAPLFAIAVLPDGPTTNSLCWPMNAPAKEMKSSPSKTYVLPLLVFDCAKGPTSTELTATSVSGRHGVADHLVVGVLRGAAAVGGGRGRITAHGDTEAKRQGQGRRPLGAGQRELSGQVQLPSTALPVGAAVGDRRVVVGVDARPVALVDRRHAIPETDRHDIAAVRVGLRATDSHHVGSRGVAGREVIREGEVVATERGVAGPCECVATDGDREEEADSKGVTALVADIGHAHVDLPRGVHLVSGVLIVAAGVADRLALLACLPRRLLCVGGQLPPPCWSTLTVFD